MTADIRFFWARLNANYWFYPALFSIMAGALAFIMVWLDRAGLAEFLNEVDWIVPARPKGAADMPTAMAGRSCCRRFRASSRRSAHRRSCPRRRFCTAR